MVERKRLDKRDTKLLMCLIEADEALYRLWRQLPLEGEFIINLNRLQEQYIHPEIRRLKEI